YAQYSGMIFSANIQQNNWFATGKQLCLTLSHSRFQTGYNFNYNNPYFTVDGVSRGFSLYYQKSDYYYANISGYSTDVCGGKMNFGYPISDVERIGFDIGVRSLTVNPNSNASQEIQRSPRISPNAGYVDYATYLDIEERIKNGVDFPEGTYPIMDITEDVLGPKGFLD